MLPLAAEPSVSDNHQKNRFISKKVYIHTWGCQMNEYDSQRILDLLREECGLKPVAQADQADVLLLNTCSVREKAAEKLFDQLGRWQRLKQRNPDVIIGVGGCVATQEGENIRQRSPSVDIIFGPQSLHRLPDMLAKVSSDNLPVLDLSFPEIEKFDALPPPKVEGPCAFISIMEGCSKYCSFCVVPYTRGEEFSRPLAGILNEIAHLEHQGVKEVTLLGQNVNAWRATSPHGTLLDLSDLINLIDGFKGIERIRYTTSHPLEMTDRLISAHQKIDKLSPHIHLPVQSGSDRILTAMKRGYTALEYKSIIRKLRQLVPHISVSSDFIVGFPGETEADFQLTLDLVSEIGFQRSFSFLYSKRPGTPAANLPDSTPLKDKKQRLYRLQSLLTEIETDATKTLIGSKQTLLVTGQSRKSEKDMQGRTPCNRIVNFAASGLTVGQFVTVKIIDSYKNSLRGQL